MGTQYNDQWVTVVKQKGFTLFELVISLLVIFILYGVLSFHLGRIAESSERAAVYGVLGQIQQQVNLKLASFYIAGTQNKVSSLVDENPFTWVQPTLKSYAGEVSANETELQAGFWYFDLSNKQMVYRVQRNEFLKVDGEQGNELKFMLKLTRADADTQNKTRNFGVKIVPVKQFTWEIKSSF